jgi:hypothetical protein
MPEESVPPTLWLPVDQVTVEARQPHVLLATLASVLVVLAEHLACAETRNPITLLASVWLQNRHTGGQ